jgi:hypothetical protein
MLKFQPWLRLENNLKVCGVKNKKAASIMPQRPFNLNPLRNYDFNFIEQPNGFCFEKD